MEYSFADADGDAFPLLFFRMTDGSLCGWGQIVGDNLLGPYGCRLMGLALEQAPYIQMAEAWGAGSTRLEEGDVVRLNEPSAAADYPAPSGAVAALTRTVQARSACSACYASLVRALHTSGVQGLPIAIGQGWRGIPFDGLGIGACCNYAKERVPGCPPPAEDILRVLSARC